MRATKAFQYLVAFLSLVYTLKAQNIEVIEALMEAYSSKEVGQPTGYFSENGKGMFEQVSMLDAMALAKRGKPLEASQQLTSLALGSILDGLPIHYRASGALLRLIQADRSYFKDTMIAVQANMKLVSGNVAQKLMAFKAAGSKTEEAKHRVQNEIKNAVAAQGIRKLIHYLHNPIMHLSKLLHSHCLQFLLGHFQEKSMTMSMQIFGG